MEEGINEYLPGLLEDHLIKNNPLRSLQYEGKLISPKYHDRMGYIYVPPKLVGFRFSSNQFKLTPHHSDLTLLCI